MRAARRRGMLRRVTCYLLHFSRPLGNPANPRAMAQHYIGFVRGDRRAVDRRLRQHLRGSPRSSAITRAAVAAGIGLELVRVWEGATREDERRLKDGASAASWCPHCRAAYLADARERMRRVRARGTP